MSKTNDTTVIDAAERFAARAEAHRQQAALAAEAARVERIKEGLARLLGAGS